MGRRTRGVKGEWEIHVVEGGERGRGRGRREIK